MTPQLTQVGSNWQLAFDLDEAAVCANALLLMYRRVVNVSYGMRGTPQLWLCYFGENDCINADRFSIAVLCSSRQLSVAARARCGKVGKRWQSEAGRAFEMELY